MKSKFLILMLAIIFAGENFAQSPVSNMRVQRLDTVIVVFYDLAATANVEAYASFDNGASFIGPLRNVTGAVGDNVPRGNNKILMWNVVSEAGDRESSNVLFRLVTGAEQTSSVLAEGNLVARGLFANVYQYDLQLLNDILRLGNYMAYQLREPLSVSEVRNIMANSIALQWYDKGLKRKRNGNITMIVGGGLALAGGIVMLTKPFEKRHKFTMRGYEWYSWGWNDWNDWNGNAYFRYYGYSGFNYLIWPKDYDHYFTERWGNSSSYDIYFYDDGHISLDIGLLTIIAGAATTLVGAIIKSTAPKFIRRSVFVYNNSERPLSRLEYDFNFTGNSAHLAIRF